MKDTKRVRMKETFCRLTLDSLFICWERQLGLGKVVKGMNAFHALMKDTEIFDVVCGNDFTIVRKKKQVLSFGSNVDGCLVRRAEHF